MTQKLPSISPTIRRSNRLPFRLSKTSSIIAIALMGTLGAAAPAFASENLVLIPDPFKLGVLLVTFILLIFPVNALIFKPVMKALDEREERITGNRERSEHLQREATAVLERYESSIRDARAEAERSRKTQLDGAKSEQAEITSAARGEAERQIESARNDLRASLADARSSLRAQAEELAREAAASVLGRSL